jgi:hypothetical protein
MGVLTVLDDLDEYVPYEAFNQRVGDLWQAIGQPHGAVPDRRDVDAEAQAKLNARREQWPPGRRPGI